MQALLIENDPVAGILLDKQIGSFGFEVTACTNGETALEAYTQKFYPLIVVDLGLPDIYGLDLCRQIRALPQGDRSIILVITERQDLEYLLSLVGAGVDDYLIKPVNAEILKVRLMIAKQQLQHRTNDKQGGEESLQLEKEPVQT